MRKVLIAFDGTHYPEAAIQFASRLNEMHRIVAVGAFMPQMDIATLWSYATTQSEGASFVPLVGDDSEEQVNHNIRRFEDFCVDHNIQYRVHKDYFDFAIPELKKETRFADLLIIGSQSFYENMGTEPNEYLKEALHDVECPVLLVPDNASFPSHNILTYDGHRSSVYAIKQFAYLLPELVTKPTTLLYAKEDTSEPFPDELNIEELAARHYPDLKLLKFGPDPKKYFAAWIEENGPGILVSGAFGRTGVHRLFHKSFVAQIIRQHKIPLFIAHN